MRVTLEGAATKPAYLLIGENWYPDWHATVDGKPAPVYRADHTLLSVVLPPGAREVTLHFASAAYARGKLVTLVARARDPGAAGGRRGGPGGGGAAHG